MKLDGTSLLGPSIPLTRVRGSSSTRNKYALLKRNQDRDTHTLNFLSPSLLTTLPPLSFLSSRNMFATSRSPRLPHHSSSLSIQFHKSLHIPAVSYPFPTTETLLCPQKLVIHHQHNPLYLEVSEFSFLLPYCSNGNWLSSEDTASFAGL